MRDITQDLYGQKTLEVMTPAHPQVDMASFRPGDPNNVLNFITMPGRAVSLRVFAAKFGTVERAFWLMLPTGQTPKSLMVVISHGFGQNYAYYTNLGYQNPLSKPLLDDVKDRFLIWRWGMQVAARRGDTALVMPVRSGASGGELGPFIANNGIGASAIVKMLVEAGAPASITQTTDVVTFSSGIYDANAFLHAGGRGLGFRMLINQDPALGAAMGEGGLRKQYLSGYTTGGPRGGFEFLPEKRWVNDPSYRDMRDRLKGQYLHTWAVPTYTLGMALAV